jgi:hypothetical protein
LGKNTHSLEISCWWADLLKLMWQNYIKNLILCMHMPLGKQEMHTLDWTDSGQGPNGRMFLSNWRAIIWLSKILYHIFIRLTIKDLLLHCVPMFYIFCQVYDYSFNLPPKRDWMDKRIVRTSYKADHFSFRISRQMFPNWSTLGWKIDVMNLTTGALNG